MEDPMMDNEPSQFENQGNMESQQDSPISDDNIDGFDAEVDADKEQDPKKYIQQLCGKLSQELRNYNQEQEKPDTELNKYVAGMIIPQASRDMTEKEKNEIISKIENGIEDSDDNSEDLNNIDDVESSDNIPMEGKSRFGSIVNEIINSFDENDKDRKEKKQLYKNKKKSPFVSKFD